MQNPEMEIIKLKEVLSVSSEDPTHKASNLTRVHSVGLKWLCSSSLRTGKMEAMFSLEQASRIRSIYICNFGAAMVELLVASSIATATGDESNFVALLPTKMLLSPQESKKGLHRTATVIITHEKLSQRAVGGEWGRVLVRCQQPFRRDEPFGLSSLILSSSDTIHSNFVVEEMTAGGGNRTWNGPAGPRASLGVGGGSPFSREEDRSGCWGSRRQKDRLAAAELEPSELSGWEEEEEGDVVAGVGALVATEHTSLPGESVMQGLMRKRTQQQQQQQQQQALRESSSGAGQKRARLLKQNLPRWLCDSHYMDSYAAAVYMAAPRKGGGGSSLDPARIQRSMPTGGAAGSVKGGGRVSGWSKNKSWGTTKPPPSTGLGGARWRREEGQGGWLSARKSGVLEQESSDLLMWKNTEVPEASEGDCVPTEEPAADVDCPLCGFSFPQSVIEAHCHLCADDLGTYSAQLSTSTKHTPSTKHNALPSDVIVLD